MNCKINKKYKKVSNKKNMKNYKNNLIIKSLKNKI